MPASTGIRYLRRAEIDTNRWDRCVRQTTAVPQLYGYSWFLEGICEHWDGLVLNDYEAVMPLPNRRKWGIRYVYPPAFAQRLEVYGKTVDPNACAQFLDAALPYFRFLHVHLSHALQIQHARLHPRSNFTIDLNQPFHAIAASYTGECTRNLRKAAQRGCIFTKDVTLAQVLTCYQQAYGARHPETDAAAYTRFEKMAAYALKKGYAEAAGVSNAAGRLIYAALLFKDAHRVYYLMGAPDTEGRQKRATYFFIDRVLQQYAGQPLLFDFEGSDLPDVAAFYQRFGPQTEPYYSLQINRLPFPLCLLKP